MKPFRAHPIYDRIENAPSCHASTVVELPDGDLLCAWYGGEKEGSPDSAHYLSRFRAADETWDEPSILWDWPGRAAGNPRLFMDRRDTLWAILPINHGKWCRGGTLFFYRQSLDLGKAWSAPTHVPSLDTLLGKNKPVVFEDGRFVLPVTREVEGKAAAVIHDPGADEWVVSSPVSLPVEGRRCIQPAFAPLPGGRLLGLFRTDTPRIWKAVSEDGGMTWSEPAATDLPHDNSGFDLARLTSGRLVLAFNDTSAGRTPLSLAVSDDGGDTWPSRLVLEQGEGEFSYPALIQARSGRLHVTYTRLAGPPPRPGRYGSCIWHAMVEESGLPADGRPA